MEKIQKFENCKIENMQNIYGGREVDYYYTLNAQRRNIRDKDVYSGSGKDRVLEHSVSNLDSWFNRD